MKIKNLKSKDKLIETFTDNLRREFGDKLKKIILFGSRARGDYMEDSDYDFVLIFDTVTKGLKNKLSEIEGDMLLKYGMVITAIPYTNDDIRKRKTQPLLLNVEKEGTVLWMKKPKKRTLK